MKKKNLTKKIEKKKNEREKMVVSRNLTFSDVYLLLCVHITYFITCNLFFFINFKSQ